MAGLATGGVQTSTTLSILPSGTPDPNNGPGVNGNPPPAGPGSNINSEAQSSPTPTSSQVNILPDASPTGSFSTLPSPTVIVFNNTANFGTNFTGRVFLTESLTKIFSWTYVNTTTTPLDIFWYGRHEDSDEPFDVSQASVSVIAHAKFGDLSPRSEIVKLNPSNATLNLIDTELSLGDWYMKKMVIKIDWEKTKNNEKGFSQSGVFTVANGTFDPKAFWGEATGNDQDTQGGEAVTSIGNPLPTGRPSSGSGNGVGGSSGGSSGGGGGGLSTGAIVGIAVSCSVVGILLIGGLAWFLLRRRRGRHFDEGYNAAGQTTNSFIATKEVQPSVAESPVVSPFSDDGDIRAIGRHSGSAAMPLPLQTIVAGRSAAGPASAQDDRADRPDTAASGNMRNISHLVEEGMTEADILRLEEEERHLDAEIERATRRTSS